MHCILLVFSFACFAASMRTTQSDDSPTHNKNYQPTWESIDSRPIPSWYISAKIGIFCHWGVYSVPAYKSEWFWWYWKGSKPDKEIDEYVKANYKPNTSYADFAHEFAAENFDAKTFRNLAEISGARYFVFTSKHHEGYTMWPSSTSWNWNSLDVGPKRDVVGELKAEFSKSQIHFGVYFSQFEFFNPYYLEDQMMNTSKYVEIRSYPQMLELVMNYQPEIIWSDGDWEMSENYWRSKEFLAWLYNESPVKDHVVVNDRWGQGVIGKHGGFLTYSDHFNPGQLLHRKWENCMSLDKSSWGYRRNMKNSDVTSVAMLIQQLVMTIACNGNLLINVGPDEHGNIPQIFEDRLTEFGYWTYRNKDAIYDTVPWIYQNDSVDIWYTVSYPNEVLYSNVSAKQPSKSKLFVFILKFPVDGKLDLPSVLYTKEIQALALVDDDVVEKIPVFGSTNNSISLDFTMHQGLIKYHPIVIRLENFDVKYRNPLLHHQQQVNLDFHEHHSAQKRNSKKFRKNYIRM